MRAEGRGVVPELRFPSRRKVGDRGRTRKWRAEQSSGQPCRERGEAPGGFPAKTEQKSLCGTDPGRGGKEAATTEEKEGCGYIVPAN